MKQHKVFKPRLWDICLVLASVAAIILYLYARSGLALEVSTFAVLLLSMLVSVVVLPRIINTISVQEGVIVIRDRLFAKPNEIAIDDIVYIGRVMDPGRHFIPMCVLYHKLVDGKIGHVSISETAYSNLTLADIVQTLAMYNPKIVIAKGYDMLLSDTGYLRDELERETIAAVEAKIRAMGYDVVRTSFARTFLVGY